MADQSHHVEMRAEEEVKSLPSKYPSCWDVDAVSVSDLEDPDSDLRGDLSPTSPLEDGLKEYLDQMGLDEPLRYSYLDRAIPYEEFAHPLWNCKPIFDMQYKNLYDIMKEKHLDEVVKEMAVILSPKRKSCVSLNIAKEIVKEYQHCDCRLAEWEMLQCLSDLVMGYLKSEELRICREYELFLLYNGYWQCYRKGERTEIQCYEDYNIFTSFDITGYRLKDVQQDFEKWIFDLMPEEDEEYEVAKKYVERDDRNRKRMLPIATRAEYVAMKLEKAEKLGIISMDRLKSELENHGNLS